MVWIASVRLEVQPLLKDLPEFTHIVTTRQFWRRCVISLSSRPLSFPCAWQAE